MFSVGTAAGDSHVRGTRQTDVKYPLVLRDGIRVWWAGGGGQVAVVLHGTNKMNWRDQQRAAWNGTRDVPETYRRGSERPGRLWGTGTRDEGRGRASLRSVLQSAKGVSQWSAAQRGETEKMKHIPMCAV